jgi:hypothetical protein
LERSDAGREKFWSGSEAEKADTSDSHPVSLTADIPPSIVIEKASLVVAFSDDVKKKASLLLPQAALQLFSPPLQGGGMY